MQAEADGKDQLILFPVALMLWAQPSCRIACFAGEMTSQGATLSLTIAVLAFVEWAVTFSTFHHDLR